MPKTTLGITGLNEILGRDYGIEEPYWGPLCLRRVNDQLHFCAGSVHTIRYRINPVQYEHSLNMKKQITEKIVMKSQSHLGLPASVFLLF